MTNQLREVAAPARDRRTPSTRPPAEFVLTEVPREGEATIGVFQRLADRLAAREAEVLSVMIYGSVAVQEAIGRAMQETIGETRWPITWIEGASCGRNPLAGVQVFAVSGRQVSRVRVGKHIVGSVFEDGTARHCVLGGLGPAVTTLLRPAQLQQTLGNLEWALTSAGFSMRDIVRTWFYNEDILAWYPEFNRVRSAYYADVDWRTGSLPASTGIGARNPAGAALCLAAWAVQPTSGGGVAHEVASPLQCPAPAYGSSFSRAMEIESGGLRRLFISGTASIQPGGRTAWAGNPKKQVDLTMEVVAAILQSRGMDFHDVTRATAYHRTPELSRHFDAWARDRDLQSMPVVSTHSVICRDDLLFELELDACRAGE